MNLTLDEIKIILEAMGFHLDYDQLENHGWIHFQLKPELDEQSLRLIWWKDESIEFNFKQAANILFKAGQKEQILKMNRLTSL